MTLKAAYSTVAASSIAEVVDRDFMTGPVARCQLFNQGSNDIYELDTGDGRRYVARLSGRKPRGPANIDYETAFLAHLDRCGIAVGAPVAGRDGALWRILDAPEGTREFAVFKRLEGRTPRANLRLTGTADAQTLAGIRAVGATLAQIHDAGASFAGPPSLYRIDGRHLIKDPLAQIVAVVDASLAQEGTVIAEGLARQLAQREPSLSVGICHGDNHGGNALIVDQADGGALPGWFDFENAAPGYLAYDLATFLWAELNLSRTTVLAEARQPLWPAFINGYRSVRLIPEPDFDTIGLFVAIRHIWLMGLYAGSIDHMGARLVSSEWFRDGFALVRKWNGLAAPAVA